MCEQMGMGATRRACLSFLLLVLRFGTRRILRGQLDDRDGVRCGSRMHRRTSRPTRVCGRETVSPADEPAQTQGLRMPVAQQASPVRSTRKLPGQHYVVEPTCSATLGAGAGVPFRVAVPLPLRAAAAALQCRARTPPSSSRQPLSLRRPSWSSLPCRGDEMREIRSSELGEPVGRRRGGRARRSSSSSARSRARGGRGSSV